MPKSTKITKYDKAMRAKEVGKTGIKWHSPKEYPFHVSGFHWFQQEKIYRRFPLKPKFTLPEAVDELANKTSGGQIRFRTDSLKISVKVNLTATPDFPHMPHTGEGGFDLYIGAFPKQTYWNSTKIWAKNRKDYEYLLFEVEERKMRDITIYFPLYQGVKKVLAGIDTNAKILPPKPFKTEKPIVVYGTSITQGGCASRPGMCYTNILSRQLHYEFLNMGFSGSGKGEPKVAKDLALIKNPACFVLDFEWNCESTELYKERLPEFIRILRNAHPETPVLLVSGALLSPTYTQKKYHDEINLRRRFQKNLIDNLRKQGDKKVYFKDGYGLLGKDYHECTVDGVHPTDLGFYNMAKGLLPVIKRVL